MLKILPIVPEMACSIPYKFHLNSTYFQISEIYTVRGDKNSKFENW